MNYTGQPFEMTPPSDHPNIPELLELLGASPALKIPCDPSPLRISFCYWNALEKARTTGGSLVTGWLILCWPGVYLRGQYHGVLKMPNGALVDVTTKPAHDPARDHSIFVVDETRLYEANYAPSIPSVYLPLTNHPRVAALIESLEKQDELNDESAEYARSIGIKTGAQSFAIVRGETRSPIEGLSADQEAKLFSIETKIAAEKKTCDPILRQLFNKPPNKEAKKAMREVKAI